MSNSHYFERLLRSAGLIARHADFPDKRQVVERCREEVEDLTSSGVISSPGRNPPGNPPGRQLPDSELNLNRRRDLERFPGHRVHRARVPQPSIEA